jgi:hypothetical protein
MKLIVSQEIENKHIRKITSMICITVLSVLAIIGIFWGKEGYLGLGICLLIVFMGSIFWLGN